MNTSKPVTSYMLEYWDKSPGPQDKPGSAKALILQRTGKALSEPVIPTLHLLSNFTFTFHFHALEKAIAPHSSVLAWKIPWTKEPGRP